MYSRDLGSYLRNWQRIPEIDNGKRLITYPRDWQRTVFSNIWECIPETWQRIPKIWECIPEIDNVSQRFRNVSQRLGNFRILPNFLYLQFITVVWLDFQHWSSSSRYVKANHTLSNIWSSKKIIRWTGIWIQQCWKDWYKMLLNSLSRTLFQLQFILVKLQFMVNARGLCCRGRVGQSTDNHSTSTRTVYRTIETLAGPVHPLL